MAYIFTNANTATVQFKEKNSQALTLNGINGTTQDANLVISGIQALLNIGGIMEDYNPTAAVRTVKQNVNNDN